jgi:hypothetical protein
MHDPRTAAKLFPPLVAAGAVALLALFGWGKTDPALPEAPPAADPFPDWPKDAKPEAVLVVTGQTYGYLQPCGCSRPQLGGLERRANFVKSLKDRGWPVAGVDLGDVLPMAGVVPEQVLLKYGTTMDALREMGYAAVGLGRAEFANGLFQVLEQYAAKKEQPPYALAGNVGAKLGGKISQRAEAFPGPGRRPMVGLVEVVDVGPTPVGVAGVVGPSVQKAAEALGPKALVAFTPEKDALAEAVKELASHPKKPQLNVLLYQGTPDEAKAVLKDFPQFRVVVALSAESAPPDAPITVTGPAGQKTLIVQVGHKGRYVGVVGAFKTPDGGLDLRYELVAMGEEYVTPGTEEEARKANPVLPLLDQYAAAVREKNLRSKFPEFPPPGQAQAPKLNLSYVGSEACAKCHEAQQAKWKETLHSHAFEALEKTAKRPAQRQFDGECIVCHTVGYGYKTGYRDDLLTPALKNVGCESCHGPGAGHNADPKDTTLLAFQSPWRQQAGDRLPDVATIEALAKLPPADRVKGLKPAEQRAVAAVGRMCAGCHDIENDPKFDLFTYWPKVAHPAVKKK